MGGAYNDPTAWIAIAHVDRQAEKAKRTKTDENGQEKANAYKHIGKHKNKAQNER
jgi:hypothetical protein